MEKKPSEKLIKIFKKTHYFSIGKNIHYKNYKDSPKTDNFALRDIFNKRQKGIAIKTLKKLLFTIATILLLTATVATILRLDAVQHSLALYVTKILNNKVGLPVEVGSIRVSLPNSIVIDSLLVKDQSQDTLASVPRLAANFEIIPLLRDGKIKVNNVTLSRPIIHLNRETPEAPLNLQFIIDKLSSSDTTSNAEIPNMCIRQVHIHEGHVTYDVFSEPEEEMFTPSHIAISNLQTNLALRALTSDTLSFYIRRISFDEASGFSLKRLKANINASKSGASISRLRLSFPQGNITSKGVKVTFPNDSTKAPASFSGELSSSNLAAKDFTAILPRLAHLEQHLKFNLKFSGTEKEINVKNLQISSADKSFSTKISGKAKNISDPERELSLNISSLTATPTFLSSIYATATDGNETPAELLRLGNIAIKGNVNSHGKQLKGNASGTSEAGEFNTNFKLEKNGTYTAELTANDINIGRITDDAAWGYCGLTATVDGNLLDSLGHTGNFNTIITPLQSAISPGRPLSWAMEPM